MAPSLILVIRFRASLHSQNGLDTGNHLLTFFLLFLLDFLVTRFAGFFVLFFDFLVLGFFAGFLAAEPNLGRFVLGGAFNAILEAMVLPAFNPGSAALAVASTSVSTAVLNVSAALLTASVAFSTMGLSSSMFASKIRAQA